MNINDLKAGSFDTLTVQVLSKKPIIEGKNKVDKPYKMCDAECEDKTGTVTVTLWNEQCEQVKPGMIITITNGWAKVYNSNLSVSSGTKGTLTINEE